MADEESVGTSEPTEAPISELPWDEQKVRMDAMLDKLKNELKEIKGTDKDLTKQFISLGGKINELKVEKERALEFEVR